MFSVLVIRLRSLRLLRVSGIVMRLRMFLLLITFLKASHSFRNRLLEGDKQDRKSGSAGMPRPISYAVFCLKKKIDGILADGEVRLAARGRVVDAHTHQGPLRCAVARTSGSRAFRSMS